MAIILNEEDFKVAKLTQWGFKKSQYKLGENRVDIKLSTIWIEAKQKNEDPFAMLSQIIFTAYKAMLKSIDLPIAFGCFNSKIGAIIDNYQVQEIFLHSDIDWTQTPSNLNQKTIERIKFLLKTIKTYNIDDFGKELKIIENRGSMELKQITKNNFINIYNEWLVQIGNSLPESVRPDCYLADLMTDGKKTIAEKLRIILKKEDDDYFYKRKEDERLFEEIKIKNQRQYLNFWSKYQRPPIEEYQEYILTRRDLLQPHNIREVKGAFFTPKIWSNKSKEYIAKAFGENWQDEYYIWDCACGTGNLGAGLINQTQVFMSTLDDDDLRIMEELQLLPDATHFQFDFLNDDLKPKAQGGKIPDNLWKIIKETPEKLIVYINPPYLEVTNAKTTKGSGKNRRSSTTTALKQQMLENGLGKESNELFMQFYYRIYTEIKECKIASFSTLKNCNAPNFENWRNIFKTKFCGGFICRANTFDNVAGKFPVSFQVWNCAIKNDFPTQLQFDVLGENGEVEFVKKVYNFTTKELINDWFANNNKSVEDIFGYTRKSGSDFQNQQYTAFYHEEPEHHNKITKSNIVQSCIYNAVRLCIPATWINDRDQFTKPFVKQTNNTQQNIGKKEVKIEDNYGLAIAENKDDFNTKKKVKIEEYLYQDDQNFISNCIVFALFEKNFTDWQIFPNSEVGLSGIARDMTVYNLLIKGRKFSDEAQAVLDIARKIYTLYYANFNDYTLGWHKVRKTLKDDKISQFDELYQQFKAAKQNLTEALVPMVYKYGFLK
jgi:hypothetical protein